ncbi:MAG: hypothetical protein OEZ06_04865 [Myxococcales bacterium]|nr:hypothetical protein [Myxococcales bacterium]
MPTVSSSRLPFLVLLLLLWPSSALATPRLTPILTYPGSDEAGGFEGAVDRAAKRRPVVRQVYVAPLAPVPTRPRFTPVVQVEAAPLPAPPSQSPAGAPVRQVYAAPLAPPPPGPPYRAALSVPAQQGQSDASAPVVSPEPTTEAPVERADLRPDAVARNSALSAAPTVTSRRDDAPPKAADDDEDSGPLDLLIFEAFAGRSYMTMALGRNDDVIAALEALPEQGTTPDLEALADAQVIDTISGNGAVVGGATSLRLAFLSLGSRLAYSSYDQAEILTVLGELAFRVGGDPVELSFGFGLGGGWLYGVPAAMIEANSGMAMRAGLGLSVRVHQNISLGLGTEAVGLFLAGKGISPAQLGDFSKDSDHPIGAQLPVHGSVSFLL